MNIEKITKYELEIYRKPTHYSFQEDKFEVKPLKIIAQNDRYIVLDTPFFCKIEKPHKERHTLNGVLNRPHIRFKDPCSHEGVFYTLYTDKSKRPSTIQKEIEKEAHKRYGWLFTEELDLSILKSVTAYGGRGK